jgi:predicted transcriptional regulator
MSTTSLKLPDDVKERAVAAAKRRGVTPHAFMVEAIRSAASAAERRAEFVAEAVLARKAVKKSGAGLCAEDVGSYLRDKARGKKTPKPKAKAWRS